EEPSAREAVDKPDVDRRTLRLEPAPAGRRLAQGATDQPAVLVEHQDVGCERVVRSERTSGLQRLVVAHAGYAMPGFENKHLKARRIAEKGDAGRHIQT